MRSRRTVQLFLPDPVPRDLILRAIDAARWAPNHRLTQPWRFYLLGASSITAVVDLNARLVMRQRGERAGNLKRERWSAIPGWLVVTCASSEDPLREREDYAACCCAVQNLMLYLWSAGVATKWTTGDVTREEEFHRVLGIPTEERIVGLVWYGFPAEVPSCSRKPVAEILVELP